MYKTSVLNGASCCTVLRFRWLLDVTHRNENKDLLAGLQTRMPAGRPEWHKVNVLLYKLIQFIYSGDLKLIFLFQLFVELKQQNQGDMFFCGSNAMESNIKNICREVGFKFVQNVQKSYYYLYIYISMLNKYL